MGPRHLEKVLKSLGRDEFNSGEDVLARLSIKLSGEDDLGNNGMYYTREAH